MLGAIKFQKKKSVVIVQSSQYCPMLFLRVCNHNNREGGRSLKKLTDVEICPVWTIPCKYDFLGWHSLFNLETILFMLIQIKGD